MDKQEIDRTLAQAKKFLSENREERLPCKLEGRFEVIDGTVIPLDDVGRRELAIVWAPPGMLDLAGPFLAR